MHIKSRSDPHPLIPLNYPSVSNKTPVPLTQTQKVMTTQNPTKPNFGSKWSWSLSSVWPTQTICISWLREDTWKIPVLSIICPIFSIGNSPTTFPSSNTRYVSISWSCFSMKLSGKRLSPGSAWGSLMTKWFFIGNITQDEGQNYLKRPVTMHNRPSVKLHLVLNSWIFMIK